MTGENSGDSRGFVPGFLRGGRQRMRGVYIDELFESEIGTTEDAAKTAKVAGYGREVNALKKRQDKSIKET